MLNKILPVVLFGFLISCSGLNEKNRQNLPLRSLASDNSCVTREFKGLNCFFEETHADGTITRENSPEPTDFIISYVDGVGCGFYEKPQSQKEYNRLPNVVIGKNIPLFGSILVNSKWLNKDRFEATVLEKQNILSKVSFQLSKNQIISTGTEFRVIDRTCSQDGSTCTTNVKALNHSQICKR